MSVMDDKMCDKVDRAVDLCMELMRWEASPYNLLYTNPHRYNIFKFASWAQRYQNYKVYMTLIRVAAITGYEPVPAELLNRNHKRDGYNGRNIRAGKISFYLIKPEEMTKKLQESYAQFKREMTS